MKRFVLPLFVSLALGGCGSEPAEATASSGASTTSGSERRDAEPDDGLEVEGLLGHISQAAVERGMERGMNAFLRCFSVRYDDVEVLGGSVELAFRVKRDGTVRWVYLRTSTVGDRVTERCILGAAARLRFQQPEGGEAEFSSPLTLDPPEDVRPPVQWSADRVRDVASGEGAQVRTGCGLDDAEVRVTAYVEPGGRVMAAGAAVDAPDREAALDCVAERVMEWGMPDPGSYPAKVTFELH